MLRFEDRHGRLMLYGPTNEELVTDILGRLFLVIRICLKLVSYSVEI